MDLFHDSVLDRKEYTFYLEQASFTTQPSPFYWDILPPVVAKYKEEYYDEVTFKYDVIKQPGSTYIYLRTPAPFEDYYCSCNCFFYNYYNNNYNNILCLYKKEKILC